MIMVSPWSKGGYVCSQVFDHTSVIRFIEARFADDHPDLMESNITPVASRGGGRPHLGIQLRHTRCVVRAAPGASPPTFRRI